jgi:uncharacterized protein (TIGR03067 family)
MFALLALAQSADDLAKAERAKLKGTWKVVSVEIDGNDHPGAETIYKKVVYVFDGDKLFRNVGTKRTEETYRIDPSSNPKTLDTTVTGTITNKFQGKRTVRTATVKLFGIYSLENGKLKWCMSHDERPTDFDTKGKQDVVILVLEPAKP